MVDKSWCSLAIHSNIVFGEDLGRISSLMVARSLEILILYVQGFCTDREVSEEIFRRIPLSDQAVLDLGIDHPFFLVCG